ncbi:MAG: site-2 protease family protein [Deltaproteobacteria bacterium]|nr:MAG: site-2 protease family protein [Deltaproteobacteria bacterium]
MTGGLRIARVFGIPIYLHPTWLVIFLLVTALLMRQPMPDHPEWGTGTRGLLAAATSLLFFASILLHELGHSVVALRHGVRVRSITLFILGGVAMMEREPQSPRAEFEIAIAGPIVSAVLALVFTLAERGLPEGGGVAQLAGWLATINFAVAVFNLLPGYPLDGGRALRAFLWARSGDPAQATRAAAGSGRTIALALIGLGALEALLFGQVIGGLWLALIGWFLLSVAGMTLRQAGLAAALDGLVARDVMSLQVPRIDPRTPVAVFASELLMRGHRWALVEDGGRVVGLFSLSDLQRAPLDDWDAVSVGSLATPIAEVVTAPPDVSVQELLQKMSAREVSQIPIVHEDRILGAVTRESLSRAVEAALP